MTAASHRGSSCPSPVQSICGAVGRHSGTGPSFTPIPSSPTRQYYSTNAPYISVICHRRYKILVDGSVVKHSTLTYISHLPPQDIHTSCCQPPDLSGLLYRSVSHISQHENQLPIQSHIQITHSALTLQTEVYISVHSGWKLDAKT
jgi:hypothetical protein